MFRVSTSASNTEKLYGSCVSCNKFAGWCTPAKPGEGRHEAVLGGLTSTQAESWSAATGSVSSPSGFGVRGAEAAATNVGHNNTIIYLLSLNALVMICLLVVAIRFYW